ncbi:MAG: hypothetical protein AAFU84_19695, partial [Cyanobacteria bacterium J06633_23]
LAAQADKDAATDRAAARMEEAQADADATKVRAEAKKADLKSGLGQCAAEMIAAQRFNQKKEQPISTIYGCVSNGTQWRFMQLQEQQLTIDLNDYPLPPVGQILAFLAWMAEN